MFEFDFDTSINHNVAHAASLLKRQLFFLFKENGVDITPDQWIILYYLWKQDGLSLGELANKSFKDNANITRIINRMETQNLVRKVNNEEDRRYYSIYLTDHANNIKDKVYKSILKSTSIASTGLTDEEQETFLRLLKLLINNLNNFAESNIK